MTATARRFLLVRREDVSGVSGTGVVAHGVVWPDGTCALRWASTLRSTAVYDDLATLEAIHGHGGSTRIEFIDATDADTDALCGLCGNPLPEGESMFRYHGYSGPCPPSTVALQRESA